MGYSLWLEDKKTGKVCQGKINYNLGSLTCPSGTRDMEMNITYNYAPYYYEVEGFEEKGIRRIYGMTGRESLPFLDILSVHILKKYRNREKRRWKKTIRQKKVAIINGEVLPEGEFSQYPSDRIEWKSIDYICDEGDDSDYWKATAKNAFNALQRLIEMAKECPEGVWNGD